MKKKPIIHITGINILLKLLIHKRFRNYKFRYYIIKDKKTINDNFYIKRLKYEMNILLAVKKKFFLNMDIIENEFYVIEKFEKTKNKSVQYITNPKIQINDDDLVSNNLFNFFHRNAYGKNVTFISEGIGTYALGKKKNLINRIIKYLILKYKLYLKKLTFSYYPNKLILFQDENKWAQKYLKYFILPYDKIELLNNKPNQEFVKLYYHIFFNLSESFSYYLNKEYQCFYPIIKRLSFNANKKMIIKILNTYDGNILIKRHGSDSRDFSAIEKISKRIILLNEHLTHFPGELFLKENTVYCGYLSTMIFAIKKQNIKFLIPQNKRYNDWAKNIFKDIESIIY